MVNDLDGLGRRNKTMTRILSVLVNVSGSREDVPHNFGSHTIPLLS